MSLKTTQSSSFLKQQKGHIIIFALIIVAAVTILCSSLLYIVQSTAQKGHALYYNSQEQSLMDTQMTGELSGFINKNIAFETSVFPQKTAHINDTDLTLDRLFKSYRWDNIDLYHPIAIGYFKADLTLEPTKGRVKHYQSVINLPVWSGLMNQTTDAVPMIVPAVHVNTLTSSQTDENEQLDNTKVGQVGRFAIHNATLAYQTFDGKTASTSLPDTNAGPWHLQVGWVLDSGHWQAYLMIFNAAEAKVSNISLKNLQKPDLTTLVWSVLIH